jgi:hypothetical protein
VVSFRCLLPIAALAIAGCGVPNISYRGSAPELDASIEASDPESSSDDGVTPPDTKLDDASLADLSLADGTLVEDSSADESVPASEASSSDAAAMVVSCDNGSLDGDETDVDCGGTRCRRCSAGHACGADTDCISAFCNATVCAMPSCADKIKNLDETDIDCGGGADCRACGLGQTCLLPRDCTMKVCTDGKCQASSCKDGQRTGDETDIDCGGTTCARCAPGKACQVAGDCQSMICGIDQRCTSPTCTDAVTNGDESDRNCGGSKCDKCGVGSACATGADCASDVCTDKACAAPTCSDGVKNDSETGPDCGGACPKKCNAGVACTSDSDCASQHCMITCQPCPKDELRVTTSAGTAYCIDATEVTVAAYAAFLQKAPKPSSVPAVCANSNPSYMPGTPFDTTYPQLPVSGVDWCDAATFCAERGKHLCGRIGARTPLLSTELQDANKSEWYNACAGVPPHLYPYGDEFDLTRCEAPDSFNEAPANVASNECQGGFTGLFDMTGNVAEWEDDCVGTKGGADACKVRGGSFLDTSSSRLRCASLRSVTRGTNDDPSIGFRCCF